MKGALDWAERHKFLTVLIVLILSGAVINAVTGRDTASPAATQPAAASTPASVTGATSTSKVAAVPQSDQQKLEAAVQSQLGGTGIQVSFKDANIDTDDPDRPPGSEEMGSGITMIADGQLPTKKA